MRSGCFKSRSRVLRWLWGLEDGLLPAPWSPSVCLEAPGGFPVLQVGSPSVVTRAALSYSLTFSLFSGVASGDEQVVAARGASTVAEASVRLSVFPLWLRVVWCKSWTASVKYGVGFVSSGGLSVYRSVFSIGVAVRWVYTVPVECNGGGNLRHKPLNDGIVGSRLLLVPPVVSSSAPAVDSCLDSLLGCALDSGWKL
ncbi:hypothetical protein DY000_02047030 [Brassica cretica]|uniref:Secreted protein n=1 Tax=Brassica cretica TaxID=69181 RepID=A0ABQ7FAG6_BRACR|nr:hypothetical protein DY000_02047030 [Brassica cretica]